MTMRMRHQQRTRRSLILCKAMIAKNLRNAKAQIFLADPLICWEIAHYCAPQLFLKLVKIAKGLRDQK